jgi:hypothetical protein
LILNGPDDVISRKGTTEFDSDSEPPLPEDDDEELEEERKAKENTWCEKVRALVLQYFSHECANIQDYVPRSLVHTVVYFTLENIQMELVSAYGNIIFRS